MLFVQGCRSVTVKVPSELLYTEECATLVRGGTNDDMLKAYIDCKSKLESANIRIEAVRKEVGEDGR